MSKKRSSLKAKIVIAIWTLWFIIFLFFALRIKWCLFSVASWEVKKDLCGGSDHLLAPLFVFGFMIIIATIIASIITTVVNITIGDKD